MSEKERVRRNGWWEDYSCGCVSDTVRTKKDLLGYCGKHGNNCRHIWPSFPDKKQTTPPERTDEG